MELQIIRPGVTELHPGTKKSECVFSKTSYRHANGCKLRCALPDSTDIERRRAPQTVAELSQDGFVSCPPPRPLPDFPGVPVAGHHYERRAECEIGQY